MSQFHLITAGAVSVEFSDLDEFTQGYIEAMFFTSQCPQVDSAEFAAKSADIEFQEYTADGVLPCDVGFADLMPESLGLIIRDCRVFQQLHGDTLALAYELPGLDYDATAAGRDYWYTRNGHGVGFWDRGLGDIGDRLSDAAERGELNPWFDLETGKVGVE